MRFASALLLALVPFPAFAASFNGHDLATLAPSSDKSTTLAPNEVVLLPAGLRAAALEAASANTTLTDHFAARGFLFVGIIGPDAALLARASDKSLDAALDAKTHRLTSAERLAPDVAAAQKALSAHPDAAFVVHLAGPPESAAAELRAALPAAEITTTRKGPLSRIGVRVVSTDASQALALLSARPQVYSIQHGSGAHLLNQTARRIVQSGATNTGGETLWARGIYGAGQICATLDTGLDPQSCYFAESDSSLPPVVRGTAPTLGNFARRKVIVYDMLLPADDPINGLPAYESHGHGTWVAGNALGSTLADPFSASDLTPTGVAPAAQLVVQDAGAATDDCADLPALGCPLIDITGVLDQAYAQGARLHNNSWGDRENFHPQNSYTVTCNDMDDATWRHPDFLIVCAAGNSGAFGNDSVGSPSVAKNVLSVAGTENPTANNIISFSSIGWADDGRIKPDICAPAHTSTAHWNASASATHCATAIVQGTSMASPITMGSLALMREYFEAGWYPGGSPVPSDGFAPSAALLKATLVAGAFALTTEPAPPSRRQGWGRVMLEDSLYFATEDRRLIVRDAPVAFSSSTDAPYELTVTSSGNAAAGNLRFVLAYTDYPATAGALPSLVNDLDLEVELADSTLYRGNSFNTSTGLSTTTGSADAINNIETVNLPAAPGTYTVRVRPSNILQPQQTFALALTGDLADAPSTASSKWNQLP